MAGERFDVLIIGGGATGLGCAVDAASRGYRTALAEANDFAAATSSRSTKLVHGGVRYLQEGDVHLVREALHERTHLLRNAPTLVHDRTFLTPAYRWWESPYYFAGLKLYDVLAGRSEFGHSRYVSRAETLERLPWLRRSGLRGSIEYHDGQFDDARLAIALARTAADYGAALANYSRVVSLNRTGSRLAGASVRDEESGAAFDVQATVTIDAAGIFADEIRRLDDPAASPILAHSRGHARPHRTRRDARHRRAARSEDDRRTRVVCDPVARTDADRHDRYSGRATPSSIRSRVTRRSRICSIP